MDLIITEFTCKSVSLPSLILHLGFIFFTFPVKNSYFSRAHPSRKKPSVNCYARRTKKSRLILPASVAPDGTRKALMRTYPTEGMSGGTTEPRSKSCSLRPLPPDLERKLRSSTIVTSVGQLVEELVCNSIDAGAHDVSVVIDTGSTLSVTVSDDGCGMSVKDVKLVATNRHSHVQNTLPLGSRRKFAHPRLQGRGTGIHS